MSENNAAGAFPGRVSFHDITIPSGETASNSIGIGAGVICGVTFPAELSGTEYNIQSTKDDCATFQDVCTEAACPISITATVGDYHRVIPQDYAGLNKLRIQSDTAEGADRVLTLHVRAID